MIRCDKGHVQIEGSKGEIMADLSTVAKCLKEHSNLKVEDIREAIEDGFLSDEEFEKKRNERINEFDKILEGKLDKLVGKLKELTEKLKEENK